MWLLNEESSDKQTDRSSIDLPGNFTWLIAIDIITREKDQQITSCKSSRNESFIYQLGQLSELAITCSMQSDDRKHLECRKSFGKKKRTRLSLSTIRDKGTNKERWRVVVLSREIVEGMYVHG